MWTFSSFLPLPCFDCVVTPGGSVFFLLLHLAPLAFSFLFLLPHQRFAPSPYTHTDHLFQTHASPNINIGNSMTFTDTLKKYITTPNRTAEPATGSPPEHGSTHSGRPGMGTPRPSTPSERFQHFTLHSKPHSGSECSLADTKDDPLYSDNESTNDDAANNISTLDFASLTLNQKTLPNDIQRQERTHSLKKPSPSIPNSSSGSNTMPLATPTLIPSPVQANSSRTLLNTTPIPIPRSKLSTSASSSTLPSDIFERNVQSEDLSTSATSPVLISPPKAYPSYSNDLSSSNHSLSHSISNSSNVSNVQNTAANPYLLANLRPRHLLSENYTSPVLDSTVELISSQQFDNTDVVEVPHAHPSHNLFKCYSHNSSSVSSPRLSFSRKLSGGTANPFILDSQSQQAPLSKSKSFSSPLVTPRAKSKNDLICTCNTNNNNNSNNNNNTNSTNNTNSISGTNHTNTPTSLNNIPDSMSTSTKQGYLQSPTPLTPSRKSISFYSYLDLVNYERMLNNRELSQQNDIYDNQENQDDLKDLSDQMLDNRNDILQITFPCPKHGPKHGSLTRRSTFQGCMEDSDAKIDETLNNDENNGKRVNSDPRGLYRDRLDYSSSAIVDDKLDEKTGLGSANQTASAYDHESLDGEEGDEKSIQSWNPIDVSCSNPLQIPRSRTQSIVEEMASLKSCTTNNSYFEDELKQCSTADDSCSRFGAPVVNVCSANDYINSRTRELRNSFVCNSNSNPETMRKLLD